ncbi:glycosyltransferase family protein [Photobacterium damselae]
MTTYISVVSHHHCQMINELNCLYELCSDYQVVVKSNVANEDFQRLESMKNFHHLDLQYGCGFGENNNIVFKYCKKVLGMEENDIFIVMNPDVVISKDEVDKLIMKMLDSDVSLAAINLFKDEGFTVYDNSVRTFPSLFEFIKSFVTSVNTSIIDKSEISEPTIVDWAAGSFLAFKSSNYEALQGFDERYFMYCEDIDICYRSSLSNYPVIFYPNIRALHLAKHANRKIFSKHFVWHCKGVFRFIITRLFFRSALKTH